MLTLHMLARDGAYEQAADGIGELIQLLDQLEPKNHLLFCEISMAYARMVGGWDCVCVCMCVCVCVRACVCVCACMRACNIRLTQPRSALRPEFSLNIYKRKQFIHVKQACVSLITSLHFKK